MERQVVFKKNKQMKRHKILMIILLIYLSTIYSALASSKQSKNIEDSILIELIKCKSDTNKVFLLLKVAKIYKDQGNSKNREFAKQALILSKELNYKKGVAHSNYFFSDIFVDYDTDIAQGFIIKALEQAKELDDSLLIAKCYNTIGIISNSKGSRNDAIDYYNKSLKMYLQMNDSASTARVFNNLGSVYGRLYKDSISLAYMLKAAKINRKYKNNLWLASNYINISRLYFDSDSTNKALQYCKMAENIIIKHNFMAKKPWLYNNYGRFYHKLKQYIKAKSYADSALALSKKYKINSTYQEALIVLNKIYYDIGNYKQAHKCLDELLIFNDTVIAKQRADKIKLMELKFEFEKEKSLQELKNNNKMLKLWTLSGGLLIMIFLLFFIIRFQS